MAKIDAYPRDVGNFKFTQKSFPCNDRDALALSATEKDIGFYILEKGAKNPAQARYMFADDMLKERAVDQS